MARTTKGRVTAPVAFSSGGAYQPSDERRLETPRSDLVVIKVGRRLDKLQVLPNERAPVLVAKVAKAMSKPGLTRAQIFQGASRKVYAYSVYTKDPSKVVREDSTGRKTVGRFIGGRFRSSRARTF